MSERQFEFTSFKRVRVAMGTWNVNGGKQFRSNILGTSELTDWLLDSPKLSGVSEFQGKTSESKCARNTCIYRNSKLGHQIWLAGPYKVKTSSWMAFSVNPKGCIQLHLDLSSLPSAVEWGVEGCVQSVIWGSIPGDPVLNLQQVRIQRSLSCHHGVYLLILHPVVFFIP